MDRGLLFLAINAWMIVFLAINQPKAVLFSLASIAWPCAYWPMRLRRRLVGGVSRRLRKHTCPQGG